MKYTLILLLSIWSLISWGQLNVSGVANSYYAISSIDNQTVTLTTSPTAGITMGDTLLLIQMQGASIDNSNSDDYGDVTSYNGAGKYELVVACEITSTTVRLKTRLLNHYQAAGLQLISLPNDNQINVNGNLTCDPWNGNKGGVVALYSNGTININADIDVSEKGFRSGVHFYSAASCNVFSDYADYAYDFSSNLGGAKGEGITDVGSLNFGRGAQANGGGGGNDHNSGGAGGSNVSAGGNGGDNDDPGTWRCKGYNPGKGGKPLDYTDNRIFLGGAGGQGHSNSSPTAYYGGTGGGIIILIANSITGNGFSILANGGDGDDGIGDGGSGGAAGGSVLIASPNITGTMTVFANGGDGGNGDGATSVTNVNTDRCFGPGGGAGAGLIWFSGASLPTGITTSLLGGQNGVVSGSTHTPCLGLAQNATPGADGIVAYNGTIEISTKINSFCINNPVFDLGNDTTICSTNALTLNAPMTGTYLWSTAETTNSISVNSSGNYVLEVDDGTYQFCDSILVTVIPQPNFDLGGNQYLCDGQSANLIGPAGYSNYLWSTTETTETINVSSTGTYWLQVGPAFCQGSDTVTVDLATFSPIFPGDAMEICSYEGLELDASRTGATYIWSTNESTPSIIVTETGNYDVEVTLSNGCLQEASVEVIPCENTIGIPNTITPNGDGVNDTWIIEDIYNYPNNSVKILDRSGRLVFDAVHYNNDWSAENLPSTVYYYIIDLGNGGTLVNGTITVIRE